MSRASELVSPGARLETRGLSRLHRMGSEVPQEALHQSKSACGADSVYSTMLEIACRVEVLGVEIRRPRRPSGSES